MAEFQRTLGRQERQLSRQNSEMSAVGNNMASTRSLPRKSNIEIGQITEHVQRVVPENRSTSRAINRSYFYQCSSLKINLFNEMSLFTLHNCCVSCSGSLSVELKDRKRAYSTPTARNFLGLLPQGYCERKTHES